MRTVQVYTAADIAKLIADHAQPGDCFTSNNVWEWMGAAAVLDHPNGTMGSGFRLAQSRGIIRSTGRIVQSTHPTRKRGMVRIWEYAKQTE